MNPHSDPTASRAIGAAEREWRRMTALAYRYRTDPKTADRIGDPRKCFTGIYRRLLTDPLEELKKEAGNRSLPPD